MLDYRGLVPESQTGSPLLFSARLRPAMNLRRVTPSSYVVCSDLYLQAPRPIVRLIEASALHQKGALHY
jgi:hypothetical protein